MRLVVDRPAEAKEYLTKEGFVVRVSDVIGAELKDEKGNLNQMFTILADGKININYIYSSVRGKRRLWYSIPMILNTRKKSLRRQKSDWYQRRTCKRGLQRK